MSVGWVIFIAMFAALGAMGILQESDFFKVGHDVQLLGVTIESTGAKVGLGIFFFMNNFMFFVYFFIAINIFTLICRFSSIILIFIRTFR